MNPEIIKWYKDNGYNVSDFFDKKRHHGVILSDAQVKGGCVQYYEEVMRGDFVPKRISIGWGPIDRARTARFHEFLKDNEIIEKWKPVIQGLSDRIDLIKGKIYTWKLLFWSIFGCFVILGAGYVKMLFDMGLL